jgi:hypothetical protein
MAKTSNDRRRSVTLGILMGAWLFILVPAAGAQEVDSRWAPWVGCWRAVDETGTAPFLCVVPLADEAGVEMLDVVDGEVVSRESVFADGQQHTVSRDGCEGVERVEFSDDSRRVYMRSDLTCELSGPRSSTGLLSMVTPYEWLDVKTVLVEGQSMPWVVRYQLASRADFEAAGQAGLISTQSAEVQMRRVAASVPVTLENVAEAAQSVSAETVQVWVVERGEPFDLDANGLARMADAGVPSELIDVVVAVSYPEKFVVNDGGPSDRAAEEAGPGSRSLGYARGGNPFVDPFYSPYSRNGYYAPYGRYGFGLSSGFGYGYGGYGYSRYGGPYGGYGVGGYNYGYGGYGAPVIVVGRRSGGESRAQEGQVARGGGYTSAGGGSASTGRSARPRSSGSSGGSSGSETRSSGSSGASSRSAPSRGSSGSSGRSTGRTAQPRGN